MWYAFLGLLSLSGAVLIGFRMFELKRKEKSAKQVVVVNETPALTLVPSDATAVLAIAAHPGFRYLRAYLGLATKRVESLLCTETPESLGRIGYLQGLRAGLRFVEDTLKRTTNAPSEVSRSATPTEQQIFEQVKGLLKPVGL